MIAALAGCENTESINNSGSASISVFSDPASVNVILGDAPANHIDSFYITVSECYLLRGKTWVRVYPAPGLTGSVRLNLTSLNLTNHLLAGAQIPPGRYRAVCITATSIEAYSCGNAVDVKLGNGTFPLGIVSYFDSPISLSSGELANISCDLNLRYSLSFDEQGNCIFNPCLTARRTFSDTRLGYFRARVVKVDTWSNIATCRLDTGATIQISITSHTMFHGRGTVYWGWSAYYLLYEDVNIRISGTGTTTWVIADCIEFEEEEQITYEFKTLVIDKTEGFVQVFVIEDVPGLQLCSGQTSWIDISNCIVTSHERNSVPLSYLCPGTMLTLECTNGLYPKALIADLVGLQISSQVDFVSGSWLVLKNISVSGFAIDTIPQYWLIIDSSTLIRLCGTVLGTSTALVPGTQVSAHAEWSPDGYVASEIKIEGRINSFGLTSITSVEFLGDGSLKIVVLDINITHVFVVAACAEIVLIENSSGTNHTLTTQQLPNALTNQTQGTINIETGPPESNSNGKSGRVVVRGNNGIGNGEDPQPPGNPKINDGPGTNPGNPGNKK